MAVIGQNGVFGLAKGQSPPIPVTAPSCAPPQERLGVAAPSVTGLGRGTGGVGALTSPAHPTPGCSREAGLGHQGSADFSECRVIFCLFPGKKLNPLQALVQVMQI